MRRLLPLVAFFGLGLSASVSGATVWAFGAAGISTVTFTKAPSADWNLAANQDVISPSVTITRQNTRGLYNPLGDVAAQRMQGTDAFVEGTQWAVEGFNGNPSGASFGAAQFGSLTFSSWGVAWAGSPDQISHNAVVHLVAEDIYFDLDMLQWSVGGGGGGGFSYERAVPEPSSVVVLALGALAGLRRRRRG